MSHEAGIWVELRPCIMSKILKNLLTRNGIKDATSSYIDDILVNKTQVSSDLVVEQLKKYGLITKDPEPPNGGAVLGLKLTTKDSSLCFSRGNKLTVASDKFTRREIFYACGSQVGHYPNAGWLRVACSYIKRIVEGSKWDDQAGEVAVKMINEVIAKIKDEDPVKGHWYVPKIKKSIV